MGGKDHHGAHSNGLRTQGLANRQEENSCIKKKGENVWQMEIRIENIGSGFIWRFYIPRLDRPACEGCMTFPSYSTAVEDAKQFRKAINNVDVPIIYETPKGKSKVI